MKQLWLQEIKLKEIPFKVLLITYYVLNLSSGLFKREEYLRHQMFVTGKLEMHGLELILKIIRDR
jgi:hypothetical protein